MPTEKTDAIVIRTVDFSETSLVVTLFTRDFGKVGALAKGARRPKNPFDSALDLLTLCRIVFLRKSSDALDLVTEAKMRRRFRPTGKSPARKSLFGLYAGYYVAELLRELTDEYDPHPELFDLADETLAELATGETPSRRVVRFELGALRLLGHAPSLDCCVGCSTPVEPVGRVAFGSVDGGVLCTNCRRERKQIVAVTAGAIKTLIQLADPNNQHWQRIETDSRIFGEIRGVMNHYLTNLLGKKPRMHQYLGMLGN